jgi:uncharacterized OsmC-like protein
MPTRTVTVATAQGKLAQEVRVGPHRLDADEPRENGGDDRGPAPHDFVLVGLGACTSMTLRLYADRKGWPLESVEVRLAGERKGDVYEITREILLRGALDAEQRRRLLEIAEKCPVHRTLTGTIRVDSKLL